MTTLTERPPPSAAASAPWVPHSVRLLPVGPALWRVLDAQGRALGHLAHTDDARFAAFRFHVGTGVFREVGSFWSAADAVECLRLSR